MVHDAIIIGGSFAGLSAALYLARARRSVCVVDTGTPRNRFSAHAHGVLGQDGRAPADILAAARKQVARYDTTQFVSEAATKAVPEVDGFSVELAGGRTLTAKRLVLAYGLTDTLPDIPGLAERWGQSVLHCPYCHGYEFRDSRLGVVYSMPMSIHQAQLIAEWGPTTLYLNGMEVPEEQTSLLCAQGITIEPRRITALIGEGPNLSAIEFNGGERSPTDALYLAPMTQHRSDITERLGCRLDDGVFGPVLVADDREETSIPGVFAAGDIIRSAHNVTWASADGVTAGMSLHQSLVFDPT